MIHIYCDGGLGNRLLTMFSAMHFAKKANKSFIIHWPSNNWCGCNFTDIFSNNYNVTNFNIKFIDVHVLNECILLIHESQISHRTENKRILNGQMSQDDIVKLMVDEPNVFYYGNQLHTSIDPDTVIEIINELTISNQVSDKISKYDVSACHGIHVRKTDYGKKPFISEDQLEVEIKNNPDSKYFICSDDKDTEMKFVKHDNVLSFEKTSYAEKLVDGGWNSNIVDDVGRSFTFNVNRTKESSIDAFCDMILLSKTATRFDTSGSSFLVCSNLISKSELIER